MNPIHGRKGYNPVAPRKLRRTGNQKITTYYSQCDQNRGMRLSKSLIRFQTTASKVCGVRLTCKMIGTDASVVELVDLLRLHYESPDVQEKTKLFVEELKKRENNEGIASSYKGNDREGIEEGESPPTAFTVSFPSSANDGPRTFDGEYRRYWKVGADVELRHSVEWLPGRVTRATFGEELDVYDVNLDNGDTVLNVHSPNLRDKSTPEWQNVLYTLAVCGAGGTFCWFVIFDVIISLP